MYCAFGDFVCATKSHSFSWKVRLVVFLEEECRRLKIMGPLDSGQMAISSQVRKQYVMTINRYNCFCFKLLFL